MNTTRNKLLNWYPIMAVLVLIVFVGGAWLWAYRTTPSASAITGELNTIPVNVTSEQLIRDGYIDLTKVGESSNVAVNEFLAEAKQQKAPVLKYINMEKGSLTAHVLWYDPYDSTPWAKAKDGSVVIYHNQTGRIRAWAWRNGEIVQNGERYSSKAVTVTKDGVNTMLLPWRPAAPDVSRKMTTGHHRWRCIRIVRDCIAAFHRFCGGMGACLCRACPRAAIPRMAA